MPPASGHWKNNPHADAIDFQIEADFIGMICPGMVNTASDFSDKIGHIMNYGDGWSNAAAHVLQNRATDRQAETRPLLEFVELDETKNCHQI